MNSFLYLRPASVGEAAGLLQQHTQARLLAGGQSLLAAMKLGLSAPTHLVDLQDVPGLDRIALEGDSLVVGAMASHASIAASAAVRSFCPMLANLARGIADEQVRQVGTLGGSLANNDPAACWPTGILALGATVLTSQREIAADVFFEGLYQTALRPGELLVGVRFPRPAAAHYIKYEQPASRFALVGVAVARLHTGAGAVVRVAVTGLGQGIWRWAQAEQALAASWTVQALEGLQLPPGLALGDIHASADYRAHLAAVLARRCVARLASEDTQLPPASPTGSAGHLAPLERFLHRLFRR